MVTKLWYEMLAQDVVEHFKTDPENGLNSEEVTHRLDEYGPNAIQIDKEHWFKRLVRQFTNLVMKILIVAGTIAGLLGVFVDEHLLIDASVIFFVVIGNGMLGFFLEGKANKATEALQKQLVAYCKVLRNGEVDSIPAEGIVPGDIILIEAGDQVPADARVFETANGHTDESILTGESVPVAKISEPLTHEPQGLADQQNMVFCGTFDTRGNMKAVVVATGMNSEFGKIAGLINKTEAKITPLQKKVDTFINKLSQFVVVTGLFMFVIARFASGLSWADSFLGAVGYAVAFIPEMMFAFLTIVLALVVGDMKKYQVLIRKLFAAETLGSVQRFFADKTGTLTENKMTVVRLLCGREVFSVTGVGYTATGDIVHESGDLVERPKDHPGLLRLGEIAKHCGDAHINAEGRVIGDPMEGALVNLAQHKVNISQEGVLRIAELPFESDTMYMGTLAVLGSHHLIFVKGAWEEVCPMCSKAVDMEGNAVPFDVAAITARAEEFGQDALRVLALAYMSVDDSKHDLAHSDLKGMTFVGLTGIQDPPKESARQAISQLEKAGIQLVMATGDNQVTAAAIANLLGIPSERTVTGQEVEAMSDDELQVAAKEVRVFARLNPAHKLRVLQAAQANNEIVAMTGDGVNDAPALRGADIGVAMGSGTSVAHAAGAMVLLDDDISHFVPAVERARHVWSVLDAAMKYTIATNVGQALLVFGAVVLALFVPLFQAAYVLATVQILWINLFDSILFTLPFAKEKMQQGLLNLPPRDPNTPIMDSLFLQRVPLMGVAIAAPAFYVFYRFGAAAVVGGEVVDPMLLAQAQTAAFWTVLFSHIGYVMSARRIHDSFFTFNPLGNPWLIGGIALSILIRLSPLAIPMLGVFFRVEEFPIEWWTTIILWGFIPTFLTIEAEKLVRTMVRHRKQRNVLAG